MAFEYAKKYSISTTTEYETGIDPFSGIEYSIPDPIEDLVVDNVKINKALFDAFSTTGLNGQVLLTDATKVFWGDVSGIGTPLQRIGLYDESNFQGTIANLNFLDGADPNNLVRAQIGVNTAFGDIYISDRWSLSKVGLETSIYRLSKVGIGTTIPSYDFEVVGNVGIRTNLIVGGATTLTGKLVVNGFTYINNDVFIVGFTTGTISTSVYSYSSGVSTYSSLSGVSTYSSLSGVSTYSSLSGVSTYSEFSGVSTFIRTVQTSISTDYYVPFVQNSTSTSSETLRVDSGIVYNPGTNSLRTLGNLTIDGDSKLNSTLQVGVAGTVVTTTNEGNIGIGTSIPSKPVDFSKDVIINKSLYDSNINVGYETNFYQVPRNVLTTVGVDTSGSIIGGRYFDAANLIRLNLDFIANESIGFLTSTDYKSPAFSLTTSNYTSCKDDIKDILKAITYDITRGGNSKSVGAGLSYYTGNTLLHITGTDVNGYSIKDATIVAITTASQIARYVINNLKPPKSYQGISSIPLIRDLTLDEDPAVGYNTSPSGCSNVQSAIAVCAGIVTTIIGGGPSAAPKTRLPDGKIIWAPAGADSKNIIWVSKYGNDDNGGKTEGDAKLTISSACKIAEPGDTIIVRPGVYYENNPIGLRTDVTVSGQDLRLVTVVPVNLKKDIFHVRRGCLIENMNFACDTGQNNVGGAAVAFPPTTADVVSGKSFAAVSGYTAPGPATEGSSGRWRSPYVRNCTNFMPKSIGMKIDGNHATASTIGADLKSMVCDSFTQYNEAGIGVSITNNGYAQLVSIFTINCDIAIYCETGGQCDLTNSNSSFGNFGLVAVGLGATEFTGQVSSETTDQTDIVVLKNVIDSSNNVRRPYDGQSLYFKIPVNGTPITSPMRRLASVTVTNGGSGYSASSPPNVTIEDGDGNTVPLGPEGIVAEVSPTVDENGSITSIDVINSGRNYLSTQNIIINIEGSGGATATAVMEPIYYTVAEATEPTPIVGITTVTFNEFIPYLIDDNVEVEMRRISRILTSGHSFEYIGTGTDINTSTPLKGAVPIKENEIVARDGAQIPYTSTDQKGNFDIGQGIQIDQTTSTIRGRSFSKAIQAEVTPLILALR